MAKDIPPGRKLFGRILRRGPNESPKYYITSSQVFLSSYGMEAVLVLVLVHVRCAVVYHIPEKQGSGWLPLY